MTDETVLTSEYGDIDPELVKEFVDESKEALDNVTNLFIILETNPHDKKSIDAVFRAVHSIKGNAAFFNLMQTKALAHIMEDLMNLIRKGTIVYNKKIASVLIKGIDKLQKMLDNARSGNPEIQPSEKKLLTSLIDEIAAFVNFKQQLSNTDIWINLIKDIAHVKDITTKKNPDLVTIITKIEDNIKKLFPETTYSTPTEEATAEVVEIVEESPDHPKEESKDDSKSSGGASIKTMRIAETTVDRFLDFVGELVIVNEMYEHIQMRLKQLSSANQIASDFKKNNDIFHAISQNLQKSLLQIRKVPIKTLLSRAPRIVRDVGIAKNKEINVTIIGDELMIDKSLIESLDAPFVHMLRNSADHGVETPQERTRAGKPPAGDVIIEVTEDDESMSISIKDDGKGIDGEFIKAKAVSNGLITAEKAKNMREEEVYQLLFAPGFSTAEVVTDISGRGVGMDVVKRNVEDIGGKILIESKKGFGSKFTIQFPKSVSVKIINGFLVSVYGERFILPMNLVGGSIKINLANITSLPDGGQCYNKNGEVVPILRLSSILGLKQPANSTMTDNNIGVIVDVDKRRTIILVSEVLGTQQIVIKPMNGISGAPEFLSGAALLGDERLAIVLAPEKFN
jgi:two-component system chemotaxis sensor kinase CheA